MPVRFHSRFNPLTALRLLHLHLCTIQDISDSISGFFLNDSH
jgi:hypothetical protein